MDIKNEIKVQVDQRIEVTLDESEQFEVARWFRGKWAVGRIDRVAARIAIPEKGAEVSKYGPYVQWHLHIAMQKKDGTFSEPRWAPQYELALSEDTKDTVKAFIAEKILPLAHDRYAITYTGGTL